MSDKKINDQEQKKVNDVKNDYDHNVKQLNNFVVDCNLKLMKIQSILSIFFDINNNEKNKEMITFEPLIDLKDCYEFANMLIDNIKYLDKLLGKKFNAVPNDQKDQEQKKDN